MSKRYPSRRTFLKQILAAGAVAGLGVWPGGCQPHAIPGEIKGANAALGHRLREGKFPEKISRREQTPVVIVGGGIAGLSAAWELARNGITEFVLLELEDRVGGNSIWGENEISAFPWGAHYLPVPDAENKDLVDLLRELGVVTGIRPDGQLQFEEAYLCASPQERLLLNGIWQEGLIPQLGVPQKDKEEIADFLAFMERMKFSLGQDGKPAFAIPLANSSADPAFTQWDLLSMEGFMDLQGWHSPYLRWYVNYCCRDDFGSTLATTSAWAGIHYFASRKGGGVNAKDHEVLTWPEGNGWIVKRLSEKFRDQIRCDSLVTRVEASSQGVLVDYFSLQTESMVQLEAAKVIFCAPQFVAQKVVPGLTARSQPLFTYAPWVTGNVVLSAPPAGSGAKFSWDNVGYRSPSLGYVNALQQRLEGFPPKETVITWYQVLDEEEPEKERQWAYRRKIADWQDDIRRDLGQMHPGIEKNIRRIDVWVWGHGMIRPLPGLISSEARKSAALPLGNIHFAHSDLSGISIFEEAFYHGVRAAREVIKEWKKS